MRFPQKPDVSSEFLLPYGIWLHCMMHLEHKKEAPDELPKIDVDSRNLPLRGTSSTNSDGGTE